MLGYTYLRIEIMTFGNGVRFIEYPNFEIGDSTENYLLRSIGTPTAKSEGRLFLVKKNQTIRRAGEESALVKKRQFLPIDTK